MRITIILAMLMGVTGSPNGTISPQAASTDTMAHPNCIPEAADKTEKIEVPTENVMATGELNPNHYPARRAAQVVQHYLNTRYGSPFRLIGVQKVHSANAEDVADSGRKYQLELSVKETISNTTENCSAELFFPRGVEQHSPKVQASCEALLKIDTKAQEEALYQEYKRNQSLVSAQNLPDSHGRIAPDMEPFWQLGILASSFIMLNESNENTLYNVAQVANITQLEIIHWKLLFTWSPAEGVKVLQMEKLPHRHEQEEPPNTN
ncbi:latexin isoform X2 [Archocentrus centrarchus]|uniref:latexin isoform X2 n=1 Tax=Archocentrus centrarchus TaxID=63155 RepID=UPI0011E9F752|nr:latexin isoform X2 [Archocentrus centrarchus]